MKQGFFYFISDEFYKKYDPKNLLMQNKVGTHNRPCFFAFPDPKNANIFWFVPISSQVEKFEKILQNILDKQIERGVKFPKCNTIRFGKVMGQKRAFLIQNMFPVTTDYITSIYIDRNTKKPVTIAPKTKKDILVNAKKVLKLVFRGYDNLVFSDILKMRSDLIAEQEAVTDLKKDSRIPAADPAEAAGQSMKERMAAAQAEADRRNTAGSDDRPPMAKQLSEERQ